MHLRHLINAESGGNDGLIFPLFFLPIFLEQSNALHRDNSFEYSLSAIMSWFSVVILYKVVFSCLLGVGIGYLAKISLQFSRTHHLIDKESFLAYSIALCAFLSGLLNYLDANDLIAIFAAGLTLSWNHWFIYEIQDEKVQEVIDLLLNLTYFIIFGAIMPWHLYKQWSFNQQDIDPAAVPLEILLPFTIAVLLIRRLPVIFLFREFIPVITTKKEAIFVGWFGPIGVGALFYGQLLQHPSILPSNALPFPPYFLSIILFVVFSSIIVHGSTVPLFNLTLRATMSITSVNVDLLALLPSPRSEMIDSLSSPFGSSFKNTPISATSDLSIQAIDYLSSGESTK